MNVWFTRFIFEYVNDVFYTKYTLMPNTYIQSDVDYKWKFVTRVISKLISPGCVSLGAKRHYKAMSFGARVYFIENL